ncbi:hypothetical protein GCM10023321_77280 [Pseudonocardia eucalypti]|uniref:Type II toxin-antitoxin system VapC family toxin n=1 Tax=Pseudonocardia eucalypti TaxID=648755 RepID=A0ABP9RBV6_9PSEU
MRAAPTELLLELPVAQLQGVPRRPGSLAGVQHVVHRRRHLGLELTGAVRRQLTVTNPAAEEVFTQLDTLRRSGHRISFGDAIQATHQLARPIAEANRSGFNKTFRPIPAAARSIPDNSPR